MGTIRDDIHERYSGLAKLVAKAFSDNPRGPQAFEYALELYLRMFPEIGALDGFVFLHVVEETPLVFRAVGIGDYLPSSRLPIDVDLRVADGAIQYTILVGSDDETLEALTDSQQWKAVYLYATEGAEPVWTWNEPIQGSLDK